MIAAYLAETECSAGGYVRHQTHSDAGRSFGPPGSSGTPVRTCVSFTVNSSPGCQKLSFSTLVEISRKGALLVPALKAAYLAGSSFHL